MAMHNEWSVLSSQAAKIYLSSNFTTLPFLVNLDLSAVYTIQYNTMENLHSKTDKHTVSLI